MRRAITIFAALGLAGGGGLRKRNCQLLQIKTRQRREQRRDKAILHPSSAPKRQLSDKSYRTRYVHSLVNLTVRLAACSSPRRIEAINRSRKLFIRGGRLRLLILGGMAIDTSA